MTSSLLPHRVLPSLSLDRYYNVVDTTHNKFPLHCKPQVRLKEQGRSAAARKFDFSAGRSHGRHLLAMLSFPRSRRWFSILRENPRPWHYPVSRYDICHILSIYPGSIFLIGKWFPAFANSHFRSSSGTSPFLGRPLSSTITSLIVFLPFIYYVLCSIVSM